jgi:hypothetical protein
MARIIGEITVDGFKIGIIRLDDGPGVASPFPDPDLHEPMSRYGSGFRRQPQSAPGGHHHEHAPPPHAGHHGRRQRFGGEGDTDPPPSTAPDSVHSESDRVYGELAAARDRARQELDEKPELKERGIEIMSGENIDPTANTALWESVINRAAVRGTSLEQELRRYGAGGYYAGYRAHPSAHERAVNEHSIARALNYSNVSSFATDNSSNQPGNHLADRDVSSGRFEARAAYNGEHFFRPLGQSQRWRLEWERLQHQSETIRAMEAHKAEAEQLASGETAP